MRIVLVSALGLSGLLLAAAPASAGFGFCMAQIPGKTTPIPNQYNTTYPSYLSEILDFGSRNELEPMAARQFVASVGAAGPATCFTHFEDAGAAVYWKSDMKGKQAGYHVETGWTGGMAAALPAKGEPAPERNASAKTSPNSGSEKPVPAAPKYVEVSGPNGVQRLSPEVAARNQAAAEDYRRKLEDHARAKDEHNQRLARHARNADAAAAAKREHERQMAVNAAQVAASEAAQLEHRKAVAKPFGVTSVYRGFGGPTCESARNSAVRGSGTSKGTQFREVTTDLSEMPRWCTVQGWSWTTSKTGSSVQ